MSAIELKIWLLALRYRTMIRGQTKVLILDGTISTYAFSILFQMKIEAFDGFTINLMQTINFKLL